MKKKTLCRLLCAGSILLLLTGCRRSEKKAETETEKVTEKEPYVPEEPDEQALNENAEDFVETAEKKNGAGEKAPAPQTVMVYSPGAVTALDIPFTSVATVSLLEQTHYAGDWDVLRPARELKEMSILTTDRLSELMREAETIIEGWARKNAEQ